MLKRQSGSPSPLLLSIFLILCKLIPNLNSDLVEVGADDGADNEYRDLEGAEHETEVPDLQPLADCLAGKEWSLKHRK